MTSELIYVALNIAGLITIGIEVGFIIIVFYFVYVKLISKCLKNKEKHNVDKIIVKESKNEV